MKKRISFFIAIMLFSAAVIFAQGGTTGPLTWNIEDGTLTISGEGAMPDYEWGTAPWYIYRTSIHSIIIETGVTTIGKRAFWECTSLTSMIIPNNVATIGVDAFSDCTSLSSITIPDSVKKIGGSAFSNCKSLTSIIIPGSITVIEEMTFSKCANLISATIPNSVIKIGGYAFMDCTSLPSVTIPNSVKSIGSYAFAYCTSLTSITIPNSVTNIGGSAFSNCKSLLAVTIPNSVTTIGSWAFDYCESLPSITIPSSVTKIGNYVFYGCKSMIAIEIESGNEHYTSENGVLFNKDKTDLICYPAGKPETSYTIPGGVANVERNAFVYCTNLISIEVENENNSLVSEGGVLFNIDKTVLIRYPAGKTGAYIIPNKVITIEDGSFHTCMGLTEITLPNSLTKIGDGAFHTCPNLAAVTIPNSVIQLGMQTFSYCPKLPSMTIPNGVTTIESYIFSGCTGLVSVTIPKSVTKIGNWAFSNCKSLTSITNLNPIPATVTFYAFNGVNPSACTLIVPASAVSAYQSADIWRDFKIVGGGILVNPVANNNQYGTTTGDGLYQQGEIATVTATPYENHKFVKWTKDGAEVSTENPYTFTVTEDVELVAVFEEKVRVEELGIRNDELWVYPNPTKGELIINNEQLIMNNVEIYDVMGRMVKTRFIASLQDGTTTIDLSNLPSGIYFIRIAGKTAKIVKD